MFIHKLINKYNILKRQFRLKCAVWCEAECALVYTWNAIHNASLSANY